MAEHFARQFSEIPRSEKNSQTSSSSISWDLDGSSWRPCCSYRKGDKKRLGFLYGYILIITASITMMLMATERRKDWIFLGIGVRIYKM